MEMTLNYYLTRLILRYTAARRSLRFSTFQRYKTCKIDIALFGNLYYGLAGA